MLVDLSFPLATVAPKFDAGVLQVFAATTVECTAAEVHHRLSRGSDEGARKVLARVVRQGVVDEVANWEVEPIHAGLFGSFTRGTADSDSDIDVLLVRPAALADVEETAWVEQLARLDQQIRAWTGNPAQIIDLTPSNLGQMARDNDPLFESCRADGIRVHGERILDLLRRLRRLRATLGGEAAP